MSHAERFAARLKELREARGLTQQQLADQIEAQREAIARWEAGGSEPKWSTVLDLAQALEVDCTAFVQAPTTSEKRRIGRPRKQTEGSAMEIVHTKCDCKLINQGRVVDAMIHLIEIHYSERVVFWNAVWSLTRDQIMRLGDLPLNDMVEVELEDGRRGRLRVSQGRVSGEYSEMSGVGTPT